MAENKEIESELDKRNQAGAVSSGKHAMPNEEEKPKKRGRGRPRKNPEMTVAEANKLARQKRKAEKDVGKVCPCRPKCVLLH